MEHFIGMIKLGHLSATVQLYVFSNTIYHYLFILFGYNIYHVFKIVLFILYMCVIVLSFVFTYN